MVMFWVLLLAISILLYVLLDGADLGVGMLFGLARGEAKRSVMLRAVAPIWDGNETWLVVTGIILGGAFPVVYATLLSAFYLPLFLILAGLILRGVAFEFRDKTQQMRWIWDLSFAAGSLLASFMQGVTVGALVEGLQVTNGQYSGSGLSSKDCRSRTVNIPAVTSAGSRHLRSCVASAYALATRFSAPAGW